MIYVLKNGATQEGPYSRDQILLGLKENQFSLGDPAWMEGLSEWKTLKDIVGIIPPPPPSMDQINKQEAAKPVPQNNSGVGVFFGVVQLVLGIVALATDRTLIGIALIVSGILIILKISPYSN